MGSRLFLRTAMVSANINGKFVRFLVDTGSCFNFINKSIIDHLDHNCVEYETFYHDIQLSGHSGQLLNISPKAVTIPVQFINPQNILSQQIAQLPFLVKITLMP